MCTPLLKAYTAGVCMHVCMCVCMHVCVRGNGKGDGTCPRVDLPFFPRGRRKDIQFVVVRGKGERHHSLLLLHHSSKKSSSESVFMALSLPALALPSPPSYRSSSSMLSLLRSNMILVSLLFCCSLETPFRI